MQESHEVLRAAFEKRTPKEIAAALGVSLSIVYKWAQADGDDRSGARNPLDRTRLLIELTNHLPIIQWLCHHSGGFFVWDPEHRDQCNNLLPATNEIIQEFANMLAVIAHASMDNEISDAEARSVRSHWEELKTIMESFVMCCENGHFSELRRAVASHDIANVADCECRPAATPGRRERRPSARVS